MNFREKIASSHPLWKVVIWLGWMAVLTIIMIVGYAMYVRATGNQSTNQLRMLQALQTLCVFILPAILATWAWTKKPFTWLGMTTMPSLLEASLVALLMLVAQPGINLIADLNSRISLPSSMAALESQLRQMEEAAQELLELFMQVDGIGGLLGCVALMALLPAIGEEMCFRGVMQGLLSPATREDKTPISGKVHVAIWVTAFVFSAIHFQFYGFFARLILGALLGYFFAWTGSLWTAILAHFMNNCTAVVLYYIGQHTTISAEAIENFGTGHQWWIGACSLLLAIALLRTLTKLLKNPELTARP